MLVYPFYSYIPRNNFTVLQHVIMQHLSPIRFCDHLVHAYTLLITAITEVNLSTFVYRLFHEDFFSIDGS